MKSPKNKVRILSTAALAASSSLLAATSARAASLSLYYGQTYGNTNASSDGIYVGTTVSNSATARGGLLQGSASPALVNLTQGSVNTINVPVGGYISISVNALLTGNSNPDGGLTIVSDSIPATEPYHLGLAALGIRVPASANDATGAILQPLNNGPSYTQFYSQSLHEPVPGYNSTAVVNTNTRTPGGPVTPQWLGAHSPGDVEMNSGSVSSNNQIFGGNSGQQLSYTPAGMNLLQQFSAPSNAYSNSTEFFRGLIYQALTPGVVTLSPFVDTSATQYWSVLTPAAQNGGVTGFQPSISATPTPSAHSPSW